MPCLSAARRISLLVGLLASFSVGCEDRARATATALTVRRVGSLPAEAAQPRASAGNVSRPLLDLGGSTTIGVTGTPGAYVELELLAQPSATSTVKLVGADRTLQHDVGARPSPGWRRVRLPLPEGIAGEFALEIDSSGPVLVSLPRVVEVNHRAPAYNVLWIVLDTVRADYLGCYGGPRGVSPRIDDLSARGVLFERAVSPASWTLPAMASLLTGLYSESHGLVHTEHRLPAQAVTLAERLAAAGFTTAAVVSGSFTDSYWGLDQGFDHYDDLGIVLDDREPARRDPTDIAAMNARANLRITSPQVTDRAIAWLEEHPQRRFFLLTHYFDPHADYLEHSDISERLAPMACPSPRLCELDPDPQATARLRTLHAGEIAFTDRHIGRLLDFLEQRGLMQHTVVVLTADHGEEFYERKFLGHGNHLFNELIHVPLIVAAPDDRARPGRRVRVPVATLDIGATLLELAGLGSPGFGQGRSLVPLLRGDGPHAGRAVFSSLHASTAPEPGVVGKQISYRVDRMAESLIVDPRIVESPALLYDWGEDEAQARNLAPERPARVEALKEPYRVALESFRAARLVAADVQLSADIREKLRALGYEAD